MDLGRAPSNGLGRKSRRFMADRQTGSGSTVEPASATSAAVGRLGGTSIDEIPPEGLRRRAPRPAGTGRLRIESLAGFARARASGWVREKSKDVPSWMLSVVFHLAILLIFWQIVLPLAGRASDLNTIVLGRGPDSDPGFLEGVGDSFATVEARQG